jgi:hypothetical protein
MDDLQLLSYQQEASCTAEPSIGAGFARFDSVQQRLLGHTDLTG